MPLIFNFFFTSYFFNSIFNEKTVYIDIEAFKRRGFGKRIYHLKSNVFEFKITETLRYRTHFFLNRMFKETEIKYWPIEFEMAGLIWVIRRVRYMIDAMKQITVVFTDHAANISITK